MLAVIAILATAMAPAIVQRILDQRVEATRDEERLIYEAIAGRQDQPGNFGFTGDIGRFPQSFAELTQPQGLPLYTTATQGNVGVGWRGPYINTGDTADDYLNDAFGHPYTGSSLGQVRSAGPDGIAGNADDIVYPPSAPTATGRLLVTVKTSSGNKTQTDPSGYGVVLYFATNGTETSISDATSPFAFENVPIGLHCVQVVKQSNPQAGSIVAQQTISIYGGRTTTVELWF